MYVLSVPSESTLLILFLVGIEINALIGSLATYYVPEDMIICSSKDITSGTAAADRSTAWWTTVIFCHPPGSV